MNTIPINTQKIEKRVPFDDGSLLAVHSIFLTIQGEGPFCGQPAVFVRLAGCNLQCPSCDTEYTEGRTNQEPWQIKDAIFNQLAGRSNATLVVITGGEPFRQNVWPLVSMLLLAGLRVQIETNGTLAPPINMFKHKGLTVVCSPKTGKVNPQLYLFIDAYKYVLSHDSMDLDGLPIRALNHTASPRVARPHKGFSGPVYLQPMDSKDEEENAKNLRAVTRSCIQNGYTVQLQLHKIIGLE